MLQQRAPHRQPADTRIEHADRATESRIAGAAAAIHESIQREEARSILLAAHDITCCTLNAFLLRLAVIIATQQPFD
jgi:hypothetical protein